MSHSIRPSCHALLDFIGDRLDPDKLIPLIPVRAWKVRKKGHRIGRASVEGVAVVARMGYCSFSTRGLEVSADINRHIGLLLSLVDKRASDVKKVIWGDNLKCEIVCFFRSQWQRENWMINDENRALSQRLDIEVTNETITKTVRFDLNESSSS